MAPKITIPFKSVRKRDGRVVPFDDERISGAVYRAMQAAGEGDLSKDPARVAERVLKEIVKKFPAAHVPAIGVAQDLGTLPRLFGSGSTASRKEQRDGEQEQEYSPLFFDRLPLSYLIHFLREYTHP